MTHWSEEAFFYHIYPLGFCGAPERNDLCSAPVPRLDKLYGWLDHIQRLGINALYLGPLFESSAHGYDTADYYHVDRRLGDDETLTRLAETLHQRGLRMILDGVFNHVGRDFWAFRDVREHGSDSPYCDWFQGLRFDARSPYGDAFTYEGWNGHYDLVRLNLANPAVRQHLLGAVENWARAFDIDGLRLDAADCVDLGFQQELAAFCRRLKPDFWLMGEIVHGDYRRWANPQTLDAVTNYECYKGLYSSLNDRNYFEIAYALERQFGAHGLYRGLPLYNFVDNHDVNRVASSLRQSAHLYPLYALLLSMPGVPSLYYGSEWGISGRKEAHSDRALRPCLELSQTGPQRDLAEAIARLADVRRRLPALRHGDYRQLYVGAQQLAFARQHEGQCVIVTLNAADSAATLEVSVSLASARVLVDILNGDERFEVRDGRASEIALPPCWARILLVQG